MKQYQVTGMSCAACSARVEKAVSKVPGVTACSVSLLTNSMGVEGTAGEQAVIAAVEAAGYGASVKGAPAAAAPAADDPLADHETPALKRRLYSSLVFLVALMCEHVRHGRLHAEGNTGEAAGSELIDVILVDRVRIGFGSDFRVGRDAPDLADGIEHGDQIAGGENCGGAAAEEHGGDRRLLDAVVELPLLGQFHFPNDHIGIVAARGPRTKIRSRVGVEVAVTAAPQAERDVDVDLEH